MVESVLRDAGDVFSLTGDSIVFITADDDDVAGPWGRSGLGFLGGQVRPLDPQFASAKNGEKGPPPHAGGNDTTDGETGSDEPAAIYLSGSDTVDDDLEYNVEIIFTSSWTADPNLNLLADFQGIFEAAADYLSSVILANLPAVTGSDGTPIDDIRIEASLVNIDGEDGVLGRAGPTYARSDSYLPTEAIMEFDIADAYNYLKAGLFDDIVLHEMLHCIGFGTVWDYLGLVEGKSNGPFADLRFTGDNAMWAYANDEALSATYAADSNSEAGVPVETGFGRGTAGGHWDEFLFDTELMTGIIGSYADGTPDGNFVSDVTIASLEDMGYDTVWDDVTNGEGGDLMGAIPTDPINDALIV